jgi:hypothetical protein
VSTYKEILQKVNEANKQALHGTNADLCGACGNAVSFEEDGSVIPKVGYRKYKDGRGQLPVKCSQYDNCLAKALLS